MALIAFDTPEFMDHLEKSGIPEKQARAISSAVRKVYEFSGSATKQDVIDLAQRVDSKSEALRHEISNLRKDMEAGFAGIEAKFSGIDVKFAGVDAKIEKAKFDLLKWIVGLFMGNFAFLVGILWKVMSIPGIHSPVRLLEMQAQHNVSRVPVILYLA